MTAVRPHGFTRSVGPTRPYAGRVAAANRQPGRVGSIAGAARRQPNRVGSTTGRNRVSDPRASTAANRQSFVKNHASERHDANNWHRDWDKHRSHFHQGHVFVFIDGFWWGLSPAYFPWDYYPYAYDDYPYDYSGNPYNYYDYSPSD